VNAIDAVIDWTRQNDAVPYYALGGDNDRDGTPDRADIGDGNGVDCSGWVWLTLAHLATLGYLRGVPYLPLGSTSTYSKYGLDHGWNHPASQAQLGDVLIHASNGDPYHSDGPVGHTGILVGFSGGRYVTSESASSKNGVGLYTRSPGFWLLAIRIPGLNSPVTPPGDDELTPEEHQALMDAASLLGNLAKPGALHDINERLATIEKALFNPGAAPHSILQDIAAKSGN